MTVTTKQVLVALLLCLVLAVTVTLGVFCFIPNFDVNEFGEYYQSALTVTQKSGAFTDTVKANYTLKLEEETEATPQEVVKAISSRLSKTYGYYGSKVEYDEATGILSVEIPKSDNTNTQVKPSAQTILNNVIVDGKVEILNTNYSNSPSYSEDSVLLTQEHFRRANVRSYINQDATLYICRVKLTKEGAELAKELSANTPYTVAIDGQVETWVYWTGNELQITYAYTDEITSQEHARAMAAYISTGALDATLTQEGSTEEIANNYGWIYLLVFGLVVLASFVFFAVRYKGLCVIPILTQALSIFVFMFFGALVHLEIFNVAMGVGVILAYAFASFFSAFTFEKIRKYMNNGKTYSWARYTAYKETNVVSAIAHGGLLVLGIILWVIPTLVTAPLGNALVYGAVLSFIATYCLNRLFAFLVGPFFDATKQTKSSVKSRK